MLKSHKIRLIGITTDFFRVDCKGRRAWNEVLQITKDSRFQHRLLFPAWLLVTINEEGTFSMIQTDIKNIYHEDSSVDNTGRILRSEDKVKYS